jgi:hypothetical protein
VRRCRSAGGTECGGRRSLPHLPEHTNGQWLEASRGLAVSRGGIRVELHAWAELGSPAWNVLRLRSPEKKCMRQFYTRCSRRSTDHAPGMISSRRSTKCVNSICFF